MIVFQDSKRNKSKTALNETIHRWESITPNNWDLLRNADNQAKNATTNIITHISVLETLKSECLYKDKILETVQRMQNDDIFNRDYMLASIGTFRGKLPLNTLNSISTIVQSEYINQGSSNKQNAKIVLFPGFFVRKTNQTDILKNYLPIDTITLPTAIRRFLRLGYSINTLLKLPVNELYVLATSESWIAWRQLLVSENWTQENSNEMIKWYFREIPFCQALELSFKNIYPTPITVASEWQLIGKSTLGTVSQSLHKKADNEFVLDLSTRKLYLKNSSYSVTLDCSHIVVISALVSSGSTGLHLEQIKQLDLENKGLVYLKNKLKSENSVFDTSQLNRLHVLKNRINKKISSLDISVQVNQYNCWFLELPEGYTISIQNVVWSAKIDNKTQNDLLPKLSTQNKKLYLLLKQYSPSFLNSKRIAEELFDTSSNTQKKVSDSIYKLQKQLQNSSYVIIRDYLGGYALIQKA
jgi:hypothetical protein